MKTETLRIRRVSLRSSQYTVARLAGLSRNKLSLIECGYAEATSEELNRLQAALDTIEDRFHKFSIGIGGLTLKLRLT